MTVFRRTSGRKFGVLTALMSATIMTAPPSLAAGEAPGGQPSAYFSQTDSELTIRKVALFPVTDNVNGIYSRPIENRLTEILKTYHQWDLTDVSLSGTYQSVEELEENPELVKRLAGSGEADAFLVAKASKGPAGLSIKLDLFMKGDGKLLAQEVLKDYPRFDLAEIKSQVELLFRKLVKRIPYDGLVLSRQGNRVTLNLGRADGISPNQMLTVVQVIKTVRHPKFNFLVSTEKEILGKIKVLKVEETLSFGSVVSELDKGVVRRLHKVAGLDQVTYPEPEDLDATAIGTESVLDRPESRVAFGKNPEEWRPVRPPSFGAVGLKLGLGSYNTRLALSTGQSLEAKTSVYPSLSVFGEMWLNPQWTVRADLEQGVIETKNPRAGSSPSELNHSLTEYSLALGYNFLLHEDFFGPKLQVRGGLVRNQVFVDDSNPLAFNTTNWSGFLLGLHGSLPVTDDRSWYVGGGLNIVIFPTLSEKPTRSGNTDKTSINDFTLFVEHKLSENLRATGSLDFSLYSASFTGRGTRPTEAASSLSQRHTMINGGVVYLF